MAQAAFVKVYWVDRHHIEAGRLLTEQKAEIPEGQWLEWVGNNLEFTERTARRYMEAYGHREELSDRTLTSGLQITWKKIMGHVNLIPFNPGTSMKNDLCSKCFQLKICPDKGQILCKKGYWNRSTFPGEVQDGNILLRWRNVYLRGLKCSDFEDSE